MKCAILVPSIPDENTTPLLGPLSLLALLAQRGHEVRLFDARFEPDVMSALRQFAPDFLGVSAVTAGWSNGLQLASQYKQCNPRCVVAFGGPHPSSLPAESIAQSAVDYVIVGEGERALVDLCDRLADGPPAADALRGITNLVFKTSAGPVHNPGGPLLSDIELDQLPWPAFDSMNLERYFQNTQAHGLFRRGKRILPIMTTRGCPCHCTFCCRMMGGKLRTRSADSVLAEVEFLIRRYGIDELYVEDDNFTEARERALLILARIAALRPRIWLKFANGVRVDRVDRELLLAMKAAGVYSLSFGIESGCAETLRRMGKNLDLDLAHENILLAKSLGFLVGANCIIGYPGDSLADLDASLNFFLGLPLDSMAIVNLVPFPGTAVRRLCEQKGYLTEAAKDWSNYYFAINRPIPLLETPELPAEEITKCIRRAYRRMYLRPSWVLHSLRHLSWRQITTGARLLLARK
jgi:anaerobic magnesium-protoporphyrin IX monomethyl ester cyclase